MTKHKQPKDPRGGHVRIYWEMLDSPAWRALSWADQGLYIALRRKLLGTNNGNIDATLSVLRHSGITSSASLAKGLRALMAVGLLDKTRQGGVARGVKVCCLYRFTDEPVLDHPKQGIKAIRATSDWKQLRTIGQAKEKLLEAHEASLRPETKIKRQLQELNRTSSVTERIVQIVDSDSEGRPAVLTQFSNTEPHHECEREPA